MQSHCRFWFLRDAVGDIKHFLCSLEQTYHKYPVVDIWSLTVTKILRLKFLEEFSVYFSYLQFPCLS